MVFSMRLKELLESKGVTWKQVSDELGIAKNSQTLWKGKDSAPDGKTLIKLSQYFGVTSDYLLGLSDSRSNEGFAISEQEQTLINLFREISEEGRLGMISAFMSIRNRENGIHTIYRAASSSEHEEPRIEQRTATDMGKLKNASTVTSEEDL